MYHDKINIKLCFVLVVGW